MHDVAMHIKLASYSSDASDETALPCWECIRSKWAFWNSIIMGSGSHQNTIPQQDFIKSLLWNMVKL